MTEQGPTSKRPSGHSPQSSGSSFSAGKAVILLASAVILGIILLQVVDTGGSAKASSSKTKATTTTTTTKKKSTTTTTSKTIAKDQVQVLVLNSANVSGAASNLATKLNSAGYRTLTPGDATTTRKDTVVFCKPSFASALNDLMQTVGQNVTEGSAPSPQPANYSQASCVVILGSTLADSTSTTSKPGSSGSVTSTTKSLTSTTTSNTSSSSTTTTVR